MTKIKSFCIPAWSKTSCVRGELLETDHCFFALGLILLAWPDVGGQAWVTRLNSPNYRAQCLLWPTRSEGQNCAQHGWLPGQVHGKRMIPCGGQPCSFIWATKASYAPEDIDKEPQGLTLYFRDFDPPSWTKIDSASFTFQMKSLCICWHPWKVMLQCCTLFQKSESLSQLGLYNTHTHLPCYLLDRVAAKQCRKTETIATYSTYS